MWFRNLKIYQSQSALKLDSIAFENELTAFALPACPRSAKFSLGWVSPLGQAAEALSYSCNASIFVAFGKNERLLPATVVRDVLQEKIDKIETEQGRKISGKEKAAMRDDVIFELLPQAFIRHTHTLAFIDLDNQMLLIDTSNSNKAESVLNLLRQTLGNLAVSPLKTKQDISNTLTQIVSSSQISQDFIIGENLELLDPKSNASIQCKALDLGAAEVKAHIKSGMAVSQLELIWQNKIRFFINANFELSRIKALDLATDEINPSSDKIAKNAADFAMMSGEFKLLIKALTKLFGGLESTPTKMKASAAMLSTT